MTGRENKRQVIRFLLVGCSSVAVDLACYLLLVAAFDVATTWSKGASYVVGMTVGFVGNKYWTFGSARRSASEPVTYVVLYAVTLAVNIGVNAAVLYQNIVWWCAKNAANRHNEHDGRFWTYNSVKAWAELFPYLTLKQIRSALDRLEDEGLILSGCKTGKARLFARRYE